MLRLKPQQYWAIIITLLVHTIVIWLLFFTEVQKNTIPTELELVEQKKEELVKEQKNKIEELAEQQLAELLSNKAAKRAVGNEQLAPNKTSETEDLQEDFQRRKDVFDKLKKRSKKPLRPFVKHRKKEVKEVDSLDRKQTIFYVGNSRVEYFLAERYREYLPIPVYKCEGAGKVEVAIVVNEVGVVVNAKLVKQRSFSASDCMKEAALQAALTSVFSKRKGIPSQNGRIVYLFAKQ